ncbi:MAG: hypothetical protein P0S94_00390 [Simkaniaceae bacterium]|nr:hypothetical protein [Simkaniaceae bacterium]
MTPIEITNINNRFQAAYDLVNDDRKPRYDRFHNAYHEHKELKYLVRKCPKFISPLFNSNLAKLIDTIKDVQVTDLTDLMAQAEFNALDETQSLDVRHAKLVDVIHTVNYLKQKIGTLGLLDQAIIEKPIMSLLRLREKLITPRASIDAPHHIKDLVERVQLFSKQTFRPLPIRLDGVQKAIVYFNTLKQKFGGEYRREESILHDALSNLTPRSPQKRQRDIEPTTPGSPSNRTKRFRPLDAQV